MTNEIKKTSKSYLAISFLIVLVCWLEVLIFWKKIPPEIPWFYSLPWGESQLMKKSGLLLMLSAISLIAFVTSYLPNWTKKNDLIIEKAIFITSTLACILFFLILSKVIIIFVGK